MRDGCLERRFLLQFGMVVVFLFAMFEALPRYCQALSDIEEEAAKASSRASALSTVFARS